MRKYVNSSESDKIGSHTSHIVLAHIEPSNPALRKWRPQRPKAQPCCLLQLSRVYPSQACLCARLRDLAWAHSIQAERSDSGDSRPKSLFFFNYDWQPFWARCYGQDSSLSLSLWSGSSFHKDTCVLTHPLLPPSSPLYPLTLSCCSLVVSLDLTPHTRQPLSGRGRAGWDGLLAACWLCFCVDVGQS